MTTLETDDVTLESEDVEEFTDQQMIHLIVEELKSLREEVSEIKHTIIQMNGGKPR